MITAALKKARKRAGITQDQLAELTGLSRTAVQAYEAGRFEPKYDALQRLAAALHCSMSELTGEYGFKDTITPGSLDVSDLSADEVAEMQDYKEYLLYKRYSKNKI